MNHFGVFHYLAIEIVFTKCILISHLKCRASFFPTSELLYFHIQLTFISFDAFEKTSIRDNKWYCECNG